ncbi:uncharacterized protein LOC126747453 [Anthonomus grandis grandis]|uniref:uncharacterized protein LOC126747453 n=1 Tax=Anthonomus grandis grandis TaxID=2921223 RepID=UPI002165BBF4|nr:uncharacterized protein LOC126747453 [Anthonomus grandis grandis]
MGSISSTTQREEDNDIWWTNGVRSMSETPTSSGTSSSDISPNQDFSEFQQEFERKHEKRREILAAKKKQFDDLREEVRHLTEENTKLKSLLSSREPLLDEFNKIVAENASLKQELTCKTQLLEKNRELKINIAQMHQELQNLNGIAVEFEREKEQYKNHVAALKDVIAVSKKMLLIRESQLQELRQKVESIEKSLSGTEMNLLSMDLRKEYEKQLESIRNLRHMYEERQRTDQNEKRELRELADEYKKELENQQKKNSELEERISQLEGQNSANYDEIKSLESNLGLSKAESRQYQAELAVINQLFSEILLGFNSTQDIDLDKLTKNLEDHHALLQTIITTPESSSKLPKVLLDLVHQVHNTTQDSKLETIMEESESPAQDQINSVEEIVQLLPKVWRVLIELLSHHKVPENVICEDSSDACYKTVQTPKGPSVVLSVSQTFIRLKDLILEKKSLEKETGHLKQLNTHLENRLQDQEKRLETVSNELNKTWHVVGKLQKEHQLLHTQEKILRHELAQKRKLLTNLREQLEHSRAKWQEAREKNSKTEKQWKQLRVEFASRRNTLVNDSNSQESGYSDERTSSDDESEVDVPKTLVSSVIEEALASIMETTTPESNSESQRTMEELLAAKEERLKRLEGQCGELMEQVTNTAQKSVMICNKLDDLHETYGHGASTSAQEVKEEEEEEQGGQSKEK